MNRKILLRVSYRRTSDKVCDQISDAILMQSGENPDGRVACRLL